MQWNWGTYRLIADGGNGRLATYRVAAPFVPCIIHLSVTIPPPAQTIMYPVPSTIYSNFVPVFNAAIKT